MKSGAAISAALLIKVHIALSVGLKRIKDLDELIMENICQFSAGVSNLMTKEQWNVVENLNLTEKNISKPSYMLSLFPKERTEAAAWYKKIVKQVRKELTNRSSAANKKKYKEKENVADGTDLKPTEESSKNLLSLSLI